MVVLKIEYQTTEKQISNSCSNVLIDKVKEAAKQERVVRSSCHYQRMIHNNTHTTPTHLLYVALVYIYIYIYILY